jgi:hypothetical protein
MSTQRNVSQRRQAGVDVSSVTYASNGADIDESKARRRRRGFTPEKQRAVALVAIMTLVSLIVFFRRDEPSTQNMRQLRNTSSLPLSKYTGLSYALEHSDLVALYFAGKRQLVFTLFNQYNLSLESTQRRGVACQHQSLMH